MLTGVNEEGKLSYLVSTEFQLVMMENKVERCLKTRGKALNNMEICTITIFPFQHINTLSIVALACFSPNFFI